MVSIITPIYNVVDYIERCVQTLFRQSYADIEYIFVDDCSTDGSLDRLRQLVGHFPSRQAQVKVIQHESNRGVAAARETGLSAATGDYVYWVDADDWIEQDAIEKMVSLSANGAMDIVACGWFLNFSRNERRMPMPCYADADKALRGLLSGQMRWNLWLFMIRREIYSTSQAHFIEGADVGEDMLVLIKLFSHAKSVAFVSEALYHYVKQNNSSVTTLSPLSLMQRQKRNIDAVIEYLTSNGGSAYQREINFFKLNTKMPLLITDDEKSYHVWWNSFPEANKYIMDNKMQSLRMRLVQLMASKKQFWIVKLYYRFVFKFVYGVIYR